MTILRNSFKIFLSKGHIGNRMHPLKSRESLTKRDKSCWHCSKSFSCNFNKCKRNHTVHQRTTKNNIVLKNIKKHRRLKLRIVLCSLKITITNLSWSRTKLKELINLNRCFIRVDISSMTTISRQPKCDKCPISTRTNFKYSRDNLIKWRKKSRISTRKIKFIKIKLIQ